MHDPGDWGNNGNTIRAVTALVEAAHMLSIGSTKALCSLLTRYLPATPPRGLSSRHGDQRFALLRAYALRAALSGQPIKLLDLAHEDLRKELEDAKTYSESREAREFKEDIGALLPWHELWATTFVHRPAPTDLANAISETQTVSARAERNNYQEESNTADEVARVWLDTLQATENVDAKSLEVFHQWVSSRKRPLFIATLTHLARLAARSVALQAYAFDYAGKAFGIIRDEREHAEQKSDSYVELARAVLMASRPEATAYFNLAVEVASRIGDENLDRWSALLDLADRGGSQDKPNPVIAYRLARCAELTYDYVVRDKHFDWEATVEAISGLCGRSSLAILSRWQDRDFGWAARILPIAVRFLVSRGDLDPKVALALMGFRAQWDEPQLLKSALESCENIAEKEVAADFAYRHITLDRQSARTWRVLKNVVTEHGITLTDLDDRISLAERDEQFSKSREETHGIDRAASQERKEKYDWTAIFNALDLSVANDIQRAYQRFKECEPPYCHEHFFAEACRRVPIGKEADFITGLADVTSFELYHLRNVLEQIPESWKSRVAVRPAIAQTLKMFCRRFCMEITRSRYYERLPLNTACGLSGIPESDIVDVVLAAIGEATEIAGASRLFTLVGLLVPKLTKDQALEALSFGLDLFDAVLEDTDADGPWSSKLEPHTAIEGSVAGYIWGRLGAPQASLRWEAAHVVRALSTLGHTKVVEHLVRLANGGSADAFVDGRLLFYRLHAHQWLLMALARTAKDHPDLIAPHLDFLIKTALDGMPHVLIREFAKKAILALLDTGFLDDKVELRQQILAVNTSTLPLVQSKSYLRVKDDETDTTEESDIGVKTDIFYFGFDMGPYWFAPLGRCFAKSQARIEREALQVIRSELKFSGDSRWDADERHRRKIFKDRETYHSHGSYPCVDDMRFYLSYHAMMLVAGRLLATTHAHHDPDGSEDDFCEWLHRHDLARRDGGWLADRRDPIPLERPEWKDEKETDEWRWATSRRDFDQILINPNGRMNLWGHWTWSSGHREESIHVRSAFVSPNNSMALLRALQSVNNPHDYRIPDADDDLRISFDCFQLRGWILDRSRDSRLDEQDPWAGAIRYPVPSPADYVTELMNLYPDKERRRWLVQGGRSDVAWSQVWGRFRDKDNDETSCESGDRFQASFTFMVSLLQKLQMDLIVEIEIERRRRYSNWESKNNDCDFILPSTRLFLLKSDGSISTL